MMRVYLSYSAADREFAKQLGEELSRRGCSVWDPGSQVLPGDNFGEKIGQALKQSKAMVVLLSPDSAKSEWVRREVEYALGDRNYAGRVFPVLVRPTDDFPWILRKFRPLRANNNPARIGERIVSELQKVA